MNCTGLLRSQSVAVLLCLEPRLTTATWTATPQRGRLQVRVANDTHCDRSTEPESGKGRVTFRRKF